MMQERSPDGKPLVTFNHEHGIIYCSQNREADLNRDRLLENTPEGVIDRKSLELIQITDLHKSIDHTITSVGSATLLESLANPPTEVEVVWSKQKAIQELHTDDRLRQSIVDYLTQFSLGEGILFRFLNNHLAFDHRHQDMKSVMKAGSSTLKAALSIPESESPYLKYILDSIKGYENSSVYRLMRGPIYKTSKGLQSKEDVKLFTPKIKFVPRSITGVTIAPSLPFFGVGVAQAAKLAGFDLSQNPELILYCLAPSVLGPHISLQLISYKDRRDYYRFFDPLRDKALNDELFVGAIDAVGALDELNSFVEFSKASQHETTLPEVSNNDRHHFTAKNLKNPVLGKDSPGFVGNDVDFDDQRLTIITGPNSGGKTTICRTIVQNQLLAQTGGLVVASEASINMADRIAYQAPQFNSMQDAEGRFGTELQRTKDIFYLVTPKSLVVLDELAEGTTREEKMYISSAVLNGFNSIGSTIILITHNHELASDFKNQGKGQFLQVDFEGDDPTFKVVGGISTVSHADRVAKKIGFAPEDIEIYLRKRGFLTE